MSEVDQGQSGFALLDAILGTIIAGLCAGALLTLLTYTSRSVERTQREIDAWAWAQALVETAPKAIEEVEVRRGVTPDGAFAWTLTLEIEGGQVFERATADVRDAPSGAPRASLAARRSRS